MDEGNCRHVYLFTQRYPRGLSGSENATLRKKSRMWVEFDGICTQFCVCGNVGLRWMQCGPALRGFVDVFEGGEHNPSVLIIASNEENGELQFEFKRYFIRTRAPGAGLCQTP